MLTIGELLRESPLEELMQAHERLAGLVKGWEAQARALRQEAEKAREEGGAKDGLGLIDEAALLEKRVELARPYLEDLAQLIGDSLADGELPDCGFDGLVEWHVSDLKLRIDTYRTILDALVGS